MRDYELEHGVAYKKDPWFKTNNLPHMKIKIINRIMSGYTYCKKDMYKIGLSNTAMCEFCGEEETTQHIIFDCNTYKDDRKEAVFKKISRIQQAVEINHYIDITNFLARINRLI